MFKHIHENIYFTKTNMHMIYYSFMETHLVTLKSMGMTDQKNIPIILNIKPNKIDSRYPNFILDVEKKKLWYEIDQDTQSDH